MNRQEMIDALSWSESTMLARLPKTFVVAAGDPDGWSDAELALMVAFTERKQADYRRRCGTAKFDWADNFIIVERDVWQSPRIMWRRKRNSWREGNMWAGSLPEAIGAFAQDHRFDLDDRQRIVLTRDGRLCRIEGRADCRYEPPHYHDLAATRLADDTTLCLSRHSDLATAADTIEEMGDAMRMAIEHRVASATRDTDPAIVAASRAAVTPTDDPALLERMWAARTPSFAEIMAAGRAAAA